MGLGLRQTAAIAAAAWAALDASAHAACVRPSPARLERPLDEHLARHAPIHIDILPMKGEAKRLRWVALSWTAPEGSLFVVDCSGHALAARRLGSVDRLRPGPMVGHRPTLEALYESQSGRNMRVQSVSLLRWFNGRIESLWSHESLNLSAAPLTAKDQELEWRWRYAATGRWIRVEGRRTVGEISDIRSGRAKGKARRTRAETYCWIPGRRHFDRCLHPAGQE